MLSKKDSGGAVKQHCFKMRNKRARLIQEFVRLDSFVSISNFTFLRQ